MATRLKTVEYWFDLITSTITDAADTNFTQITVYLPESSKSFKSVTLNVVAHDLNTTIANVTRRQISVQLGAAGYSAVNNANTITQSGEQMILQMTGDFTSYFNTNWSGSSMTCDARLLFDSGTLGFNNASAKLTITYEYDDTSATHVKTVCIPLNAPTTTLATSKPGSPTDTIPALDTYLPEASKSIRQMAIIVQGSTVTSGTTDHLVSIEIDSAGAWSTANYEAAANSDMWAVISRIVTFTTNATHSFYIWGGAAGKFNHPQIWLSVTYEFDPAASSTIMNSLWLPCDTAAPIGGTTSSDYQRFRRELMVEEPATISTSRLAFYMYYDNIGGITGLNVRLGTGSFVGYTDSATNTAGGVGLMVREDSAFTLARGRNVLTADVYRTDTADFGMNLCGVFLVNYTSGKASDGVGAHNHTVVWNLMVHGTAAPSNVNYSSAIAPGIPETSYFLTAIGTNYQYLTTNTTAAAGVGVLCERLTSDNEDGGGWESVYADVGGTDAEVGIRQCWSQARELFRRWPGDPGPRRLGFENSRRWGVALANNAICFHHLDLLFTYHTITFTAADSASGFANGTLTISLHREDGEKLLETTRTDDGPFSFTWYDDTEALFVSVIDSAGVAGRSELTTAA